MAGAGGAMWGGGSDVVSAAPGSCAEPVGHSLRLLHLGQGAGSPFRPLVGVWEAPHVGHAGAGSRVSPANEVVLSLAVRAPGWMPQACL